MSEWFVTIKLQFPAMPLPTRVNVNPRQLHFLDSYSERRIEPDGTVIYLPTPNMPSENEACVAQ